MTGDAVIDRTQSSSYGQSIGPANAPSRLSLLKIPKSQ